MFGLRCISSRHIQKISVREVNSSRKKRAVVAWVLILSLMPFFVVKAFHHHEEGHSCGDHEEGHSCGGTCGGGCGSSEAKKDVAGDADLVAQITKQVMKQLGM